MYFFFRIRNKMNLCHPRAGGDLMRFPLTACGNDGGSFIWLYFFSFFFTFFLSMTTYAFTVSGFSQPYGVVIDPVTNQIYVSNMNGTADVKDANGFISRLSSEGALEMLRFIDGEKLSTGLHAPKGMVIVERKLYVADITALHHFSLPEGKFLSDIDFGTHPPQHLYDIAVGPEGKLFAVDALTNTIYRIADGKAEIFVQHDRLGQPHSLLWNASKQYFLVAGWSSGEVTAWDLQGKQKYIPSLLLKTLEGMARDDREQVYVTSLALRSLFRIKPTFALTSFQPGIGEVTDIGFLLPKKELVIVFSEKKEVTSIPIPKD